MAKSPVIKGTKDRRKYQIIKGSPDQRELRCRKCGNVARQTPDGKGGFITKCGTCQAEFKFTPM